MGGCNELASVAVTMADVLTLLVALAATAVSINITARNWPTYVDGSRIPRHHVPMARQARLLEYPGLCFGLGLLLSIPSVSAGGGPTVVVSLLVAISLGGLLVMQTAAIKQLPA